MASEHEITGVVGEEIKDSRGNPTMKVTVFVNDVSGSFSVPSGASTGSGEAHTIATQEAIEKINNAIAPALMGKDVLNQKEIDKIMLELDGTMNKNNLGGNSMIGVSIACAKVAAKVSGKETFEYLQTLAKIKSSRKVPHLYMNLINGGKHARTRLAFQEYLIVPETDNVLEAIEIGMKIQNSLKEKIIKKFGAGSAGYGDEGGFAIDTEDIKEPLYLLHEAIKDNGLENKVRLALDVAASSFYEQDKYKIGDKYFSAEEMLGLYEDLIKEFNLLSIEDPFQEKDFQDFEKLSNAHEGLLVVGDDLTVTNIVMVQDAIKNKSIKAMIIKPNQIGTLTETLDTMKLARENDIELIVSHRSGETDDDFIADLAYAFGVFGLKAGAPSKPERMIKYKRLEKIAKL